MNKNTLKMARATEVSSVTRGTAYPKLLNRGMMINRKVLTGDPTKQL
jgi:hypothetical protein